MIEELSVDNDKTDEDAEFIPLEDGDDDEEVAVDDEGDIEVFEEKDNNDTDDDEASSDEDVNYGQGNEEGRTFDSILSKSGVLYTPKELPNRRRRRNILTQRPRVIATLQTESKSFEHMLTEEIMRTILRTPIEKLGTFVALDILLKITTTFQCRNSKLR